MNVTIGAGDVKVEIDRAKVEAMVRFANSPAGVAVAKAGTRIENEAKQKCPVDTGRLRSSIGMRPGVDGKGMYVDVGSDVEYAAAVEFGTFRTRAQPYLRPALDAVTRFGSIA